MCGDKTVGVSFREKSIEVERNDKIDINEPCRTETIESRETNKTRRKMAYEKKADGIYLHRAKGRLMEHKGYSLKIFWSKQMIDDLRRLYARTLNEELASMLGVSVRTMIRKARELGLEKDKEWLRAIWDERRMWAQIEARRKGHPGCFKKGNEIGAEFRFKPGDERLKKGGEIWQCRH